MSAALEEVLVRRDEFDKRLRQLEDEVSVLKNELILQEKKQAK